MSHRPLRALLCDDALLGLDLDSVLEGSDRIDIQEPADREAQVVMLPPLSDRERSEAIEAHEHALKYDDSKLEASEIQRRREERETELSLERERWRHAKQQVERERRTIAAAPSHVARFDQRAYDAEHEIAGRRFVGRIAAIEKLERLEARAWTNPNDARGPCPLLEEIAELRRLLD